MIQAGHAVPGMSYAQVDPFQRLAARQPGRSYADILGNRYSTPTPTFDAMFGRGPRNPAGLRATIADKMVSQPTWMGNSRLRRGAQGLRFAAKGLPIDAAFTAADMLGSGMVSSVRWAAKTGREEDYIGGFVFGATKAAGANVAATTGAIAGAAIGTAFGGPIGGVIGGLVGGIGGYTLGEMGINNYAYDKGRFFSDMAASSVSRRKIEFGNGFQDSQAAYTMRQLAVQEMAGSLLNARQYLGNEAYFMHR